MLLIYIPFLQSGSHTSDLWLKKLVDLHPELLTSVVTHLEKEGSYTDLDQEQRNALDLLKHVNTIAAHIPGSQASKIFTCNEIHNYIGLFGLPHIYLTMNPNTSHSPIFQVIFGDKTVDLTHQFPQLVVWSRWLAKDLVAMANFFDFCINAFLQHLLGCNERDAVSSSGGGLLGHLQAYYGMTKYTERGSLHGHFVLWLEGGLNPSDLHKHLVTDPDFERQFFAFFDQVIHHDLLDVDFPINEQFKPCTQHPPHLDIDDWDNIFVAAVKACGEVLQRHICKLVCHKYNNKGHCQFLFLHKIVDALHFDLETNLVALMCCDSTVNYYNPYILVFCRHNPDIKCILSGKVAKAVMFYITKTDMKTHEMFSLMSDAVLHLLVLIRY